MSQKLIYPFELAEPDISQAIKSGLEKARGIVSYFKNVAILTIVP